MSAPALDAMTAEETALLKQMQEADSDLTSAPEPGAEPEPAPEAQATDPEPREPPPAEKLVDKRALDEERNRRKKADERVRELENKYAADLARANTRFEMLAAAAEASAKAPAAPPVAEAAPPEFNADPQRFIEHGFKTVQQRLEELARDVQTVKSDTTQTVRQRQEAAEADALQNWAMGQEAEYARETPDYNAAVTHLKAVREAQVQAFGIDNPAEVRAIVANDVRAMARAAQQKGRNFGEVLYKMAEASGYRKGAPPASSAAPAARSAPVDVDSAAERLIRGQDMATTIGSTGAAPRGAPAATQIANMSDEAFSRLYEQVKKQGSGAMRNLFGG